MNNMIKSNLTFALVMTATFAVNAGVVSNLQAGKLSEADIANTEKSLTISGQMNAADFAYIFDNLNSLEELNIYNVDIVAYDGTALPYTGMQHSPAAAIPDYALTGLKSLNDITLPASLKSIGKGALSGTGITELNIPNGVTSIGDYAAMRCGQLRSVIIPQSVKNIGTRAFAYCPELETVNISAQLNVIPEGMFEACGGLHTLSLSNLVSCTEIGPWAVAECKGLNSLILPSGSKAISNGAVYGASGIQTLALPSGVNYIGDNAMSAMTSLLELNVTDVNYVPDLGENVWGRVDQSKISLITPNELVQDYKDAEQWNKFHIVAQSDWESSTETIASTIDGSALNISVDGNAIALSSNKPMGRIAIFNTSGQRIVAVSANFNAEISTSGWVPGVYLVVTEIGAAKVTVK